MVWRERETGPAQPSIRSAPSTGTFGMSLSVTTFMMSLLGLRPRVKGWRLAEIRRLGEPIARRVASAPAVMLEDGDADDFRADLPGRRPAWPQALGRGQRAD